MKVQVHILTISKGNLWNKVIQLLYAFIVLLGVCAYKIILRLVKDWQSLWLGFIELNTGSRYLQKKRLLNEKYKYASVFTQLGNG